MQNDKILRNTIGIITLIMLFFPFSLFSQEFDFSVISQMSKKITGYKDTGNIDILRYSNTQKDFFGSFGSGQNPPRSFSRVNFLDNSLSIIPFTGYKWGLGPLEKTYLILSDNKETLLTYDYQIGEIIAIRDISTLPSDSPIKKVIHRTYYYQNDIGYIQKQFLISSEDVLPSKIGVIDFSTFEESTFPVAGVIHAISPDKKYLLIDKDEQSENFESYKLEDRDFILYEIATGSILQGYGVPFMGGGDPGDIDYGGHFVGNENVLLPFTPKEDYLKTNPKNYFLQYIGDPEHTVKLNLTAKGKQTNFRFSPDFTRALCEVDHIPYLVDSTPFRNWLMTHNLLFKETTAKVTDTHIRVRENPNLQAKHMGFLEQGETVKVLDRSGPKETIDPWGEHPWYRIVRESDGLSGWCFGAFLNLAEEQGELRYTGEGMITVYEE